MLGNCAGDNFDLNSAFCKVANLIHLVFFYNALKLQLFESFLDFHTRLMALTLTPCLKLSTMP